MQTFKQSKLKATCLTSLTSLIAITVLTACSATNNTTSSAIVENSKTGLVVLESQTKITDGALHFDGNKLNHKTFENPSKGPEYDYFFGKNISAHGDAVKPYKHYVFMTWYKGGKDNRNVMLSRLNTKTGKVKTIQFPHQHTGFRGDPLVGESHNTIGLAVSPLNGTIHMVYDMHAYVDDDKNGRFKGRFVNDFFRYSYSVPGAAEVSDEEFTLAQFVKDTSEVSQGSDDYKHLTMTGDLADKDNFAALTYPKFYTTTDGTLIHYMRWGGNNNGAYYFNKYDAEQQKWTRFTPFNHKDQKTHGHPYNWGLYGYMKYLNGKLRVSFQQRSADNNDRYKYQNGVYYAYSDHPDGMGEWKNHKGEPMTWPLVNSDEIKVFEPGDYMTHQEPNSVYIVGGFDWTVTENEDIHIISKARSTDRKRADYEEVAIHAYKPAGASEFKISTDFTGGDSIYTAGDDIFIIGLKNGYPYVEKAKGGTNDFVPMYQQKGGTKFDHGTIHIKNGKAYYYLMEQGEGSSLPLYLQIIDLGIN
ncbi:BNR-4 repeat-containing protein [Catenovulum agarivorans]|uniref:BNR-4 repeat-containing protein n=1 Tax=Catenovulum agarivorans TaxID=1172192 RepID=UPI0002DF073F|nr:BNR-4 repeat-containing protein [Catenovulum agarivorans]